MKWARSRLAQLVLALVLILVLPLGTATRASAQAAPAPAKPVPAAPRAHGVPDEEVTVLKPPPPPAVAPPAPDIAAPPDLSAFLGRPLVAVDVVMDDDRWPDEHPPTITEMRPGERMTPALLRRAIAEALASGHFADAHVELVNEGAGVHATIHVMPRKVIDSIRLEAHGAPIDGDEPS